MEADERDSRKQEPGRALHWQVVVLTPQGDAFKPPSPPLLSSSRSPPADVNLALRRRPRKFGGRRERLTPSTAARRASRRRLNDPRPYLPRSRSEWGMQVQRMLVLVGWWSNMCLNKLWQAQQSSAVAVAVAHAKYGISCCVHSVHDIRSQLRREFRSCSFVCHGLSFCLTWLWASDMRKPSHLLI